MWLYWKTCTSISNFTRKSLLPRVSRLQDRLLTITPWQPTLHHISPSSQEVSMAPPSGRTACLSLPLSIHLPASRFPSASTCLPLASPTAHSSTHSNTTKIACKNVLQLGFEPWVSRYYITHHREFISTNAKFYQTNYCVYSPKLWLQTEVKTVSGWVTFPWIRK